jgi:hypothetical protein
MSKTFHAKFERFKKRRMNGSHSFGKGFGRRKKMKRKIVSFAIVFDVLQEGIKKLPVFFRNRGSERFDRGELGGEGFGGGHRQFFKSSPRNANHHPSHDSQ